MDQTRAASVDITSSESTPPSIHIAGLSSGLPVLKSVMVNNHRSLPSKTYQWIPIS